MKHKLTKEQEAEICYIIGEWYLDWKHKLVDYDTRTHNLGFAKEMLKAMICNSGNEE